MFAMKKGAVCPICEKGELDKVKKDLEFTCKKRSKKFPNESVYKCNICDYEGLSENDNERIDKSLTDFRRGIDNLLSCDRLCGGPQRNKLCIPQGRRRDWRKRQFSFGHYILWAVSSVGRAADF